MTIAEKSGTVNELWPLLRVTDIERSIAFYRDQLGFDVVGDAKSDGRIFWCRLKRDSASVMLQQAEAEDGPAEGRGRGVGFFFVCNDADAVYDELTGRGLKLKPPTTAYYGMRQVFVPEPDGYKICFESPCAKG
ncbi:MAG: VOC family protein [Phycisphaeraceae bacterium]|nr:VOC family protein [Phycisphaeraceae bacterium]